MVTALNTVQGCSSLPGTPGPAHTHGFLLLLKYIYLTMTVSRVTSEEQINQLKQIDDLRSDWLLPPGPGSKKGLGLRMGFILMLLLK